MERCISRSSKIFKRSIAGHRAVLQAANVSVVQKDSAKFDIGDVICKWIDSYLDVVCNLTKHRSGSSGDGRMNGVGLLRSRSRHKATRVASRSQKPKTKIVKKKN